MEKKSKSWERNKFLLINSAEVLAGPCSWTFPTTAMLLSAGCNRREELWLTIVNVGEATLSPHCAVIFRLSVPLEASLYWASVLKIEKNGHLLLLGDCYIVCDYFFLLFIFFSSWIGSAVRWMCWLVVSFIYTDSKVYDYSRFYTAHKSQFSLVNKIPRF